MKNRVATPIQQDCSCKPEAKANDKLAPTSGLRVASLAKSSGIDDSSAESAFLSFWVARALALVETEYSAPQLNLDLISRRLNVTKSHFCRVFKREVGLGFPDYVCRVRARQAEKLLRETALRVKEIAAAVGFAHVTQLDRAFKAAYGLAPKEFRGRLFRTNFA
jgi:AraC-like DNA-binding protein